ncbi:MAG: hypothetical protein ACRELF_29960, partial [Gemmataceae bacterium]
DNLFGLETLLRKLDLAEKVDTHGPLEVVLSRPGFAITRPTEKWGQIHSKKSDDAAVDALQTDLELLLVQVSRHAFIDVRELPPIAFVTLQQCQQEILDSFEEQHPRGLFDADDGPHSRVQRLDLGRALPAKDGMEGRETELMMTRVGKPWHFIFRFYRRGDGPIYVVRAYAPKRGFAAIQGELRTALESFRILRR